MRKLRSNLIENKHLCVPNLRNYKEKQREKVIHFVKIVHEILRNLDNVLKVWDEKSAICRFEKKKVGFSL